MSSNFKLFLNFGLDTIDQYLILLEKDDHIFLHSKDLSFSQLRAMEIHLIEDYIYNYLDKT